MFSRTEIKAMAGAGSYSRGIDIYATDRVMDFHVESDGDYDEITARVKGTGRGVFYDVSIIVDKTEEKIEDSNCECPAYAAYSGLCKHCVAVLLEYNDYQTRQLTLEMI